MRFGQFNVTGTDLVIFVRRDEEPKQRIIHMGKKTDPTNWQIVRFSEDEGIAR
jgi:hypothetical protein